MTQATPLHWPAGWSRTPDHKRQRARFDATVAGAYQRLGWEIGRMGGRYVVVSSNLGLRKDRTGPLAGQPTPTDPGVAVYFERRGKQMVFACDKWDRPADNMRAIEKTIDAMRGIERWGASEMMERAFSAFEALPAPGRRPPWWTVLGVEESASRADVEAAYRRKARERHPDTGGSDVLMAELNLARDEALRATERAA